MHYANGREAKPGDQVVLIKASHSPPLTGVLHSIQPGSTTCNGRLAVMTTSDPFVTLGECLHIDDVRAATIPDTSAK